MPFNRTEEQARSPTPSLLDVLLCPRPPRHSYGTAALLLPYCSHVDLIHMRAVRQQYRGTTVVPSQHPGASADVLPSGLRPSR